MHLHSQKSLRKVLRMRAGDREPRPVPGLEGDHGSQQVWPMMDTERIRQLIDAGNEHLFYCSTEWRKLRARVIADGHNECTICRSRGKYSRAVVVHHIKHLKDRPDLALTEFDPVTKCRQLIPLCKACHEDQHPERMQAEGWQPKPPVTEERWD